MAHVVVAALVAVLIPAEPSLAERIAPIAKAHKGKVAVAVKHLVTGEEFHLNADEVMPTASLIKTAVMVEAYWQAEEGKVKLDDRLTLKADDKVPGAGVLTDSFTPGATFALRDAVRLMMTVSDNTATNMVLDKIGLPSTNDRMEKLDLKETKIHAKVYKGSTTSIAPERTKKYGLGSTTAREMVTLLELLHAGKVVTPKACEEMLGIMRKNQDNELMMRLLPNGAVAAHKTGAVNASRTDAGILYLKGKPAVALCVLTTDNQDQRWVVDNEAQLTIAKVAKEVHDHFAEKK
jgi:beta-lactamase class A